MLAGTPAALAEKCIALLIRQQGLQAQRRPLVNPLNDVRLIGEALQVGSICWPPLVMPSSITATPLAQTPKCTTLRLCLAGKLSVTRPSTTHGALIKRQTRSSTHALLLLGA